MIVVSDRTVAEVAAMMQAVDWWKLDTIPAEAAMLAQRSLTVQPQHL